MCELIYLLLLCLLVALPYTNVMFNVVTPKKWQKQDMRTTYVHRYKCFTSSFIGMKMNRDGYFTVTFQ